MPFNPDPRFFPMPTLEQGSPLGGILSNAIAKRLAMAKAQAAEKEVPYAGLSKLAQIMSQSAYANAVTPQFQAKLLGVPGAIANLKNPQTTLNNLATYGATGSTGNVLNDYINRELMKIAQNEKEGTSSGGGFLGKIGHGILNLFGGGEQSSQNQPVQLQQPQTAYNQPAQPAPGMQPLQPPAQPVSPLSSNQKPTGRTEESLAYGENQASHNKQIAKGTAIGKAQGEQESEYGDAAKSILAQDRSIQDLKIILKQPILDKIANVPFASQKSIAWYKQTGTQAEKKALGEMESAMNTFISSSFGMFGKKGVTDIDMKFLQSMKPNDTDTMDVRRGKIVALETWEEAQKASIKLAHQYMKQGMDQADAEFEAASQININAIRDKAYDEVFSKQIKVKPSEITADDINHTAEKLGIPVSEVIKRLNKKGIYLPEGAIK